MSRIKAMLYKFIHIFILINLLASSSGLTIYEHTCKIKGKSYSLFSKDKICCSGGKNTSCSSESHNEKLDHVSFKKKRCCENKTFYDKLSVESTPFDKVYKSEFDGFVGKILIKSGFKLFSNEILLQKTINTFLYHPPPESKGNLRVLFQSFLC